MLVELSYGPADGEAINLMGQEDWIRVPRVVAGVFGWFLYERVPVNPNRYVYVEEEPEATQSPPMLIANAAPEGFSVADAFPDPQSPTS